MAGRGKVGEIVDHICEILSNTSLKDCGSDDRFLNQARAATAARAWFLEIVLVRVSVCVCVCVCPCVRPPGH